MEDVVKSGGRRNGGEKSKKTDEEKEYAHMTRYYTF